MIAQDFVGYNQTEWFAIHVILTLRGRHLHYGVFRWPFGAVWVRSDRTWIRTPGILQKETLIIARDELVRTITRTEEEGRQADDDPTVDLRRIRQPILHERVPVRPDEHRPRYPEHD